MEKLTPAAKKSIRNLVVIISCGVLSAFLVTFFLLYFYNPTGIYFAKNALLAPKLVKTLAYEEFNSKSRETFRYTINDIQYSYFDNISKTWNKSSVSQESYNTFYQAVMTDSSVWEVTDTIVDLFAKQMPAKLVFWVKRENSNNNEVKVFQEVQFANGSDYYRIELREQSAGTTWAYFHHPQIYQLAQDLFRD